MPDESHEGRGLTRGAGGEGRYANHFQVGHNAFEFLLDFGQLFADQRPEYFHTRIVTSPRHAKELLTLLGGSIEQFERSFGLIGVEDPD
jgi:uncharacterized protein DUF3467